MQIQDPKDRFDDRLTNKIETVLYSRLEDLDPLDQPEVPNKPPKGWQEPLPTLQIVPHTAN